MRAAVSERGPWLLRDGLDSGPDLPEQGVITEDEAENPGDPLRCRACGATITQRNQQIAVSGKHFHTFFNPAGIVYELGCFRRAPGCRVAGSPSSEFTWFAGYLWRYALCRGCATHLGWYFQGEVPFFGLIVNRLV